MKTANKIRQEELKKGCGYDFDDGTYCSVEDGLCEVCKGRIEENILAVKNEREEVLKLIDLRIKIHERHFNRYEKETKTFHNDKNQVEYSETQAIKEMNIIDELKELKQKLGVKG